uniref:Uncharacterized protein n=1 Tax=Aquisalinus luteolus TaxID=1566827 RepID=A0A8J3A5K4_9PROT|nr:hypothetical protein GCM10011355_30720 [Aquisalinus luteolus]
MAKIAGLTIRTRQACSGWRQSVTQYREGRVPDMKSGGFREGQVPGLSGVKGESTHRKT